ncbi:hypothetical protein TWF694_005377 [Orbilia ellipsospora]|uniref:Glycosyl transferase CAP10 domain-containing protein n=1 Tax=Orbilia ellipsospora TaxID=2528407 RepID=A0AAV9WSX6_9PEZI
MTAAPRVGRSARPLLIAILAIFTTFFIAVSFYDPELVRYHVVDKINDLTNTADTADSSTCFINSPLREFETQTEVNDTTVPFTSQDGRNYLMTEAQCDAAFPGLYAEIHRAVEDRRSNPVTLEELERVNSNIYGYFRGMIYNQQLYVIRLVDPNFSRGFATLMAMHRAIITSPEPLPNIEFTFNTADFIEEPAATWTYARRHNETLNWLMPDFGYWSWPEPKVGSYHEVRLKALIAEESVPWEKKIQKIVWRGATLDLPVRLALLNKTEGQEWADVKALDWGSDKSKSQDLLSMSDHCHYRFVAHTEGHSYSGRLKYLQQCRSVVIAHKLDWVQHYHSLLESSGPNQNYVECERDFSDLEKVIKDLTKNPKKARRIADNSVKLLRDRYLTPAAEACYWRKFIKGWRSVSFEPKLLDESGRLRGVPIESFILERRTDWVPY